MATKSRKTNNIHSRHLLGVVIFVLFNLGYVPLYFVGILGVPLNMHPYDASGQGSNYFVVSINIIMVLLGFALAAYLGARVGVYRDFWRAFTLFILADFLFCFLILLTVF